MSELPEEFYQKFVTKAHEEGVPIAKLDQMLLEQDWEPPQKFSKSFFDNVYQFVEKRREQFKENPVVEPAGPIEVLAGKIGEGGRYVSENILEPVKRTAEFLGGPIGQDVVTTVKVAQSQLPTSKEEAGVGLLSGGITSKAMPELFAGIPKSVPEKAAINEAAFRKGQGYLTTPGEESGSAALLGFEKVLRRLPQGSRQEDKIRKLNSILRMQKEGTINEKESIRRLTNLISNKVPVSPITAGETFNDIITKRGLPLKQESKMYYDILEDVTAGLGGQNPSELLNVARKEVPKINTLLDVADPKTKRVLRRLAKLNPEGEVVETGATQILGPKGEVVSEVKNLKNVEGSDISIGDLITVDRDLNKLIRLAKGDVQGFSKESVPTLIRLQEANRQSLERLMPENFKPLYQSAKNTWKNYSRIYKTDTVYNIRKKNPEEFFKTAISSPTAFEETKMAVGEEGLRQLRAESLFRAQGKIQQAKPGTAMGSLDEYFKKTLKAGEREEILLHTDMEKGLLGQLAKAKDDLSKVEELVGKGKRIGEKVGEISLKDIALTRGTDSKSLSELATLASDSLAYTNAGLLFALARGSVAVKTLAGSIITARFGPRILSKVYYSDVGRGLIKSYMESKSDKETIVALKKLLAYGESLKLTKEGKSNESK